MRVSLSGISNSNGNIRLALYPDDPDAFLEGGQWIGRIDLPANGDKMDVCLELPHPGTFALAVLHDEDADGKYDVFKEGYGFSNNPKLFLGPPDYEDAAFSADGTQVELNVEVRYFYPNRKASRRRGR